FECFRDLWIHVGQFDVDVIRCWGPGLTTLSPSMFPTKAFLIAGFPKLYSLISSGKAALSDLSQRIVLIIVDEAHKVLAPTNKEVTKALLGNTTRVIGLTATPGRSAVDAEQNKALADFFFNEIVSISAGNRSVIAFLRQRGVLAEVILDPLLTQLDYELSDKD